MNTYATRLRRFQVFCRHLDSLGIKHGFPEFPNEEELLGIYYFELEKDYASAYTCYRAAILRDGHSRESRDRFIECCAMLNQLSGL
jgi:hypothetical protein